MNRMDYGVKVSSRFPEIVIARSSFVLDRGILFR